MNHQLANKRALVTGGGRGIGAAIVRRLAREGAHVALTYVGNPDQADKTMNAAQALGVRALAIQADSADAGAVVAAVEQTVSKLGGIDITINNIHPGPVETDMNHAASDFGRMLIQVMALPRYGTGDEIASLVAYLAGPEAGYVTGASLSIDGGFTS